MTTEQTKTSTKIHRFIFGQLHLYTGENNKCVSWNIESKGQKNITQMSVQSDNYNTNIWTYVQSDWHVSCLLVDQIKVAVVILISSLK